MRAPSPAAGILRAGRDPKERDAVRGQFSFEEPDGGAAPHAFGGSFTCLTEDKSVEEAVQKFEDLINSRHAPGRRVRRL